MMRCEKREHTSNGSTLVQVVAGTAPKVDSDGSLGGRLPGQVDSLAGLGVEALRGNVERVGSVGLASLSSGKEGGGSGGQERGSSETHVDDDLVKRRKNAGDGAICVEDWQNFEMLAMKNMRC